VVGVCVLLAVAFVPRQAEAEATFDLGLKGGVSFANTTEVYDGEKFPTASALTGPVFGVFVSINLSKTFSFQPEAYLLTQGGIWGPTVIGDSTFKWEHAVKYIQVPLLAKFRLVQDKSMTPVLFAGPAVDILVSANEKEWIDDVLTYDESFTDWVEKLHFGAVFGGGVEFKLDKMMLSLEVRYNLGLTNTIKDPDPGQSYKYRTWMVMAGVGF
jgi:opacity protein-like surface antigen